MGSGDSGQGKGRLSMARQQHTQIQLSGPVPPTPQQGEHPGTVLGQLELKGPQTHMGTFIRAVIAHVNLGQRDLPLGVGRGGKHAYSPCPELPP